MQKALVETAGPLHPDAGVAFVRMCVAVACKGSLLGLLAPHLVRRLPVRERDRERERARARESESERERENARASVRALVYKYVDDEEKVLHKTYTCVVCAYGRKTYVYTH